MKRIFAVQCLVVVILTVALPASAGIQLAGTRVIYPAAKREVTLALTNNATTPRLIQAWMDNGDPDRQPAAAVPFIVTPPVFRLDPGKGQTLRILFTGGAVPADRESVFWLNVLEIPPRTAEKESQIQFPTRTRIKVFYRPKGLTGSVKEADETLRWRLVNDAGQSRLECENPSAFNVSFARLSLNGVKEEDNDVRGMCPAKGRSAFALPGVAQGKIYFTTINDYGGQVRHEAVYSR